MSTKGYWYIVYGPDRYMEEAACSIESLLEVDPGAHVSILIDQKPTSGLKELVDFVEVDKNLAPKSSGEGLVDGKFEGKLYNLDRSPYDHTFCVDTDTYFYEDCSKCFVLLIIAYHLEGLRLVVTDVKFVPIEFLGWDCLTIGALGWGQIQIANANNIVVNRGYSRKKWMLELCDVMLEFYPKEISKIGKRLEHFRGVRENWLSKPSER